MDTKPILTEEEYFKHWPRIFEDDYIRYTCPTPGKIGHQMCGMCPKHDVPRFRCGCYIRDGVNYHKKSFGY